MSRLDRELRQIEQYLRSHSISAFATGSRVQGVHAEGSDLDIVVIDEDVDVEELEEQLTKVIDAEWPIDVVGYKIEEIITRVGKYDPFMITMVQSMEPLTLESKTIEILNEAVNNVETDVEFIRGVIELNTYRAAESLAQAIIYEAYRRTANAGCPLVPPHELPELVADSGVMPDRTIGRVLQLKRQVEDPDSDTQSALGELIEIANELGFGNREYFH